MGVKRPKGAEPRISTDAGARTGANYGYLQAMRADRADIPLGQPGFHQLARQPIGQRVAGDQLADFAPGIGFPVRVRRQDRLDRAPRLLGLPVAMRDQRAGKLAVDVLLAGHLAGMEARLGKLSAQVMAEEEIEVRPRGKDRAERRRFAQDLHALVELAGEYQP